MTGVAFGATRPDFSLGSASEKRAERLRDAGRLCAVARYVRNATLVETPSKTQTQKVGERYHTNEPVRQAAGTSLWKSRKGSEDQMRAGRSDRGQVPKDHAAERKASGKGPLAVARQWRYTRSAVEAKLGHGQARQFWRQARPGAAVNHHKAAKSPEKDFPPRPRDGPGSHRPRWSSSAKPVSQSESWPLPEGVFYAETQSSGSIRDHGYGPHRDVGAPACS